MITAKYISLKEYGITQIKGSISGDMIIINADLSPEEQRQVLHHEMLHFLLGHVDGSRKLTASECEFEIHQVLGDMIELK